MHNPTPDDIRAARSAAGITQAAAADLVYSTRRTWENWERGINSMHPAIFELFCIKIGADCQQSKNVR